MNFKISVYIRPALLISAIVGAILGVLALIPIVNFFVLMLGWLVGGLTVFALKNKNLVGILTINDGAIIGALAGFVSTLTAFLIYVPIAFILGQFIPMYAVGFSMNVSFLVASFNLFVLFMLVCFIGLINAVFSSFSGVAAAFVYQKLEASTEVPEFHIDITDS